MTDAVGTIEQTVAEVQAWWARREDDHPIDAVTAGPILTDLFERSARVGADLRDPTPELLRWLIRDLARDDDLTSDDYAAAALTLPRYLLFLRDAGRWRRSERAVQDCWDVLGWASRRPLGIRTIGETIDATIAQQLTESPDPSTMLDVATRLPFIVPMRTTLDELARRGELTRDQVAAILGTAPDAVDPDILVRALDAAVLMRLDPESGLLTPREEVTDAGGCPPPSTPLVRRILSGLVTAVLDRGLEADAAAGLTRLPRGLATIVALVAGTDESYFLADGDDDEERTTLALLGTFVEIGLDGADDERLEALACDALADLEALARFGLLERTALPRGGEALMVPAALRRQVIRAVADRTGCVGTEDEAPGWQPVDRPSRLAPDAAVDLLVTLEQMPGVHRRFRVLASESLETLHRFVQLALGWRGMRDHVLCDADGTRRFAAPPMLRSLRADADEAVTDSSAAAIGAVLVTPGSEMLYEYGSLTNPWRLRLRAERVTSGMKESIAWLDAEGTVPAEPSLLWEQLQPRLPEAMVIPEILERAWVLMESRGWGAVAPAGHALLAPGPPDARPAVIFSAGLTLDDWCAPGGTAASRLLPIAASPDGTRLALWMDDGGATRVVALGPEGDAFVVGEHAADLLRLAAIGYPEISAGTLGRPPASPDHVAGVAEFRAWVQGELGLPVPPEWHAVGGDWFQAWLHDRSGEPVALP